MGFGSRKQLSRMPPRFLFAGWRYPCWIIHPERRADPAHHRRRRVVRTARRLPNATEPSRPNPGLRRFPARSLRDGPTRSWPLPFRQAALLLPAPALGLCANVARILAADACPPTSATRHLSRSSTSSAAASSPAVPREGHRPQPEKAECRASGRSVSPPQRPVPEGRPLLVHDSPILRHLGGRFDSRAVFSRRLTPPNTLRVLAEVRQSSSPPMAAESLVLLANTFSVAPHDQPIIVDHKTGSCILLMQPPHRTVGIASLHPSCGPGPTTLLAHLDAMSKSSSGRLNWSAGWAFVTRRASACAFQRATTLARAADQAPACRPTASLDIRFNQRHAD